MHSEDILLGEVEELYIYVLEHEEGSLNYCILWELTYALKLSSD